MTGSFNRTEKRMSLVFELEIFSHFTPLIARFNLTHGPGLNRICVLIVFNQ